jgi:CHAP domain
MRARPLPTLFVLLLAGCAASGSGSNDYIGGSVRLDCAPFARVLSGVRIAGAAGDWWALADGRYARGDTPSVGSVLVLRRSRRLPNGHVAVVSAVLDRRRILVTHANWVHHRVSKDQPVVDVSAANDWSVVRVWWPPSAEIGVTDYPAYGFIHSGRLMTHDQLLAAAPFAIRLAAKE